MTKWPGHKNSARKRPTGMNCAFLSVKTQFENVGDALIVRELVKLTSQRIDTFVDLSRCPPAFRRALGLDTLANVVCLETLGTARLIWKVILTRLTGRRPYYFLVPGGRGGEMSMASALRAWLYNLLLALLRVIGVRVCHVGISYDRLGLRHGRILRWRSKLLYEHAVRDDITREYLETHGVRVDRVLPDLAVNIFGDHADGKSVKDAIALSFRVDKYPDRQKEIEQSIHEIVRARGGKGRVKFVSQVRRDDEFMKLMAARIREAEGVPVEFHACHDDIMKARAAYEDCASIYSNRLHALLLATSTGAKPIAVIDGARDVKIRGAFRSLGLEDRVIELGTILEGESVQDIDLARIIELRGELAHYFDELFGIRA